MAKDENCNIKPSYSWGLDAYGYCLQKYSENLGSFSKDCRPAFTVFSLVMDTGLR